MDFSMNSDEDSEGPCSNSGRDMPNNESSTSSPNPTRLSKAELRKNNKPIMEKRRRARINHCLNQLKTLILEAMRKDPARHTKLEKADILEMTVKHLHSIQRHKLSMAIQTDPTVIHKFKTGFSECAEEVKRYLRQLDTVDAGTHQRLSNYLNNCVNNLEQIQSFTNFSSLYQTRMNQSPTVSDYPTQIPFPVSHDANNNGRMSMNGINLIPSVLPSGEVALIIPTPSTSLITPKNTEVPPLCPPIVQPSNVDLCTGYPRMSAFSKPPNKMTSLPINHPDTSSALSTPAKVASPPLSPISSISSQEDDSIMHTSSDFTLSSLDGSHNSSRESFTRPSSAKRSYSQSVGVQYFEESTPKKRIFEGKPTSDSNGNSVKDEDPPETMWRPW